MLTHSIYICGLNARRKNTKRKKTAPSLYVYMWAQCRELYTQSPLRVASCDKSTDCGDNIHHMHHLQLLLVMNSLLVVVFCENRVQEPKASYPRHIQTFNSCRSSPLQVSNSITNLQQNSFGRAKFCCPFWHLPCFRSKIYLVVL